MDSSETLILITNDDGVHAPGIKHLWQTVIQKHEAIVAAPSQEQSAVGLSVTIRQPLRIEPITWHGMTQEGVWSISGTPVDTVKLACHSLLPRPPNLIVSGINRGSNAGRNLLYSGTVAAVIEGVLQGIPGIAFSMVDYPNPFYEEAKPFISHIIDFVLQHPLPAGTFLNVNFPKRSSEGIKGVRLTRQGKEFIKENPELRRQPGENSPYYWLGSQIAEFDEDEESDIHWLKNGFAAAVPIHISELTHHHHLDNHRDLFEKFINQANARYTSMS